MKKCLKVCESVGVDIGIEPVSVFVPLRLGDPSALAQPAAPIVALAGK